MTDLYDGDTSGDEGSGTNSMEDTIRDTLRDINSRNGNDHQESEDSSIDESHEASNTAQDSTENVRPSRKRDEKGRFATLEEKEPVDTEAVDGDTTTAKVAANSTDQNNQQEDGNSNTIDSSEEVAATQNIPPNTWKKEAKEAFSKADPIVQAEILRREQDFHRGIQQYRSAAEFATSIDAVISPYKQTMQQLGITPDKAISGLLAADHKLRFGDEGTKHMYFAQLAQSYGIDLNKVIDTAHNTDPRIYQLNEQNQQAQQQLDMYRRQMEMQETQQLNSQVASFAADPNHKYFDQVREQMAQLLQAGAAKDLSDAYEQAIYLNPDVRQQLLQQQIDAARNEARQKAQAAKGAATPAVRSRQPLATEQKVGSMEDTIRETYRRLHGAA